MSPSDWHYVVISLLYENIEDAMEILWQHRQDRIVRKVMRLLEKYDRCYDDKILMDTLNIIQRYTGVSIPGWTNIQNEVE